MNLVINRSLLLKSDNNHYILEDPISGGIYKINNDQYAILKAVESIGYNKRELRTYLTKNGLSYSTQVENFIEEALSLKILVRSSASKWQSRIKIFNPDRPLQFLGKKGRHLVHPFLTTVTLISAISLILRGLEMIYPPSLFVSILSGIGFFFSCFHSFMR